MVALDHSLFKVGKTLDPNRRLCEVARAMNVAIDKDASLTFTCRTYGNASSLESLVHKALRLSGFKVGLVNGIKASDWYSYGGLGVAINAINSVLDKVVISSGTFSDFRFAFDEPEFLKDEGTKSLVKKQIFKIIDDRRASLGMRVNDVANASGLTRSTYYTFCNGENLGIDSILSFAEAVGALPEILDALKKCQTTV